MNLKLDSRLSEIKRFGLFPVVVPAPAGAATFDRMILVYPDPDCRRMPQVYFYNTVEDAVWKIA